MNKMIKEMVIAADAKDWEMVNELAEEITSDVVLVKTLDEKDKSQFNIALRLAAEAGDSDAMVQLGNLLREGDFLEKNCKEAVKWIEKAAKAGNDAGLGNLALCYYYGDGVEVDYQEAFRLFTKIAALELIGTGDALLRIGDMYQKGLGVKKNENIAVRLFKRAVNYAKTKPVDSYSRNRVLGDAYMRLGKYHMERKDFITALSYYVQALEIQRDVADNYNDYWAKGSVKKCLKRIAELVLLAGE